MYLQLLGQEGSKNETNEAKQKPQASENGDRVVKKPKPQLFDKEQRDREWWKKNKTKRLGQRDRE